MLLLPRSRGSDRPETFVWQDVFTGATPLTRDGPRVFPPAACAGPRCPSSASLELRQARLSSAAARAESEESEACKETAASEGSLSTARHSQTGEAVY